jgi:hypothetical protein
MPVNAPKRQFCDARPRSRLPLNVAVSTIVAGTERDLGAQADGSAQQIGQTSGWNSIGDPKKKSRRIFYKERSTIAALVESCTEPVTEPLVTWPNALALKIKRNEKTARRAARFGWANASIIIYPRFSSTGAGVERTIYQGQTMG